MSSSTATGNLITTPKNSERDIEFKERLANAPKAVKTRKRTFDEREVLREVVDNSMDVDGESSVDTLLRRVLPNTDMINEPQSERHGCYYDIFCSNRLSHKDVVMRDVGDHFEVRNHDSTMVSFVGFWIFTTNIRICSSQTYIYLPNVALLTPALLQLTDSLATHLGVAKLDRNTASKTGMEVNLGSPLTRPIFRYTENGNATAKQGADQFAPPFNTPVRFFFSLSKIWKHGKNRFVFVLQDAEVSQNGKNVEITETYTKARYSGNFPSD